jgi:hypothetical protein
MLLHAGAVATQAVRFIVPFHLILSVHVTNVQVRPSVHGEPQQSIPSLPFPFKHRCYSQLISEAVVDISEATTHIYKQVRSGLSERGGIILIQIRCISGG